VALPISLRNILDPTTSYFDVHHLKESKFGLQQWTQSLFMTTTIKQRRKIGHFIHDDGSEDTDLDQLFRALN